MLIIKEMYEAIGREEREIERQEADINKQLQAINDTRAKIYRKRWELQQLERLENSQHAGLVSNAGSPDCSIKKSSN